MTRQNLLFGLFALLLLAGCSRNIVVNVDGVPVSNHEYVMQDEETGLRVSYVLTRYYKKHFEDDEYMIVPEYLNAWNEQVIDPSSTESLILHIKIVNLKRTKYTVWYELATAAEKYKFDVKNLYLGKLPRKDFSIHLPIGHNMKAKYRVVIEEMGGGQICTIGDLSASKDAYLSYSTKGGVVIKQTR